MQHFNTKDIASTAMGQFSLTGLKCQVFFHCENAELLGMAGH